MMRVVVRSHPKSITKQASKPPKAACSLSNRPPRTPLPALPALLPFTPKLLSTVRGGIIVELIADLKGCFFFLVYLQSMALETLSLGFLKPNILRPVLYNETASSDKVGCMEKAVRDMTSFETGVRLAGLPGKAFIPFISATRRKPMPFISKTSRFTIASPPCPSTSPSKWTI